MEKMIKDKRFARLARDPKLSRIPKSEHKVKIDKRFQAMFDDKKFAVKSTIDKRGRPLHQSSKENLKKYYALSSEDDYDNEEDETIDVNNKNITKDKNKYVEQLEENQEKRLKNKFQLKQKDSKLKNVFISENKIQKHIKKEQTEEKELNITKIKKKKEIESNKLVHKQKKHNNKYDNDEQEDVNEDEENSDSDENNSDEINSCNEKNTDGVKDKGCIKRYEEIKLSANIKKKLRNSKVDYARGEGLLFSDSSSSEEEDEEDENADNSIDEDEIVHNWGEFDKDAETNDDIVTNRLAVCNMDWDRIRAIDLMVLFNSFLPKGKLIKSVTIYPSEFGLERMKEEDLKGPKELIETKCDEFTDDKTFEVDESGNGKEEDEEEEEEEEGLNYHREKMRQYQINRLKYYYAIVVCDSPESAQKLYTECDGIEFELSGAKLDLRYVPDDTTFDQDPREVCNKLPDFSKYQPRQFTTTALQQVKVDLTWDENDPNRLELIDKLNAGRLEEVSDSELKNYLASGSSDEESEQENVTTVENSKTKKIGTLEKYRALLKNIEEEEKDKLKTKEMEFEVTWDLDAKEKTEKLIKESQQNSENLTPFEKYLEKRKEKKKAKRDEKKKLKSNDNNDSDEEDSVPSDIDMNDPYFAEEMQSIKKSSKKRKINEKEEPDAEVERRKAELELLLMDKDEGNKKHFNMKKIEEVESMSKSKKKRMEKKHKKIKIDDDFEVNVNDPRFALLYKSHEFNIDPSDPHYRNTRGSKAFIDEKLKKRIISD